MAQEKDAPHEITQVLADVAKGRPGAADELFSRVYDQLRGIARKRLSSERPDHTLGATELVHEAYLALVGHLGEQDWANRRHFYHAAAEAMRRILIDHARRRGRIKRGGGMRREFSNLEELAAKGDETEILAVDEAIQRLEKEEERLGQIVRLRFFAGLSVEEVAQALGSSPRTIAREWTFARAWLRDALDQSLG